MKVFAWIKFKKHPQPDSSGMQEGDICYFYPMVEDQGRLTMDTYLPVVVDLNIPCGKVFQELKHNCTKCKFNNPESCEVINFRRGIWSPGSIDKPPKIVKKRKFFINRSAFLSPTSEALITKKDKTKEDKALIITNATNNEQPKNIIQEKL